MPKRSIEHILDISATPPKRTKISVPDDLLIELSRDSPSSGSSSTTPLDSSDRTENDYTSHEDSENTSGTSETQTSSSSSSSSPSTNDDEDPPIIVLPQPKKPVMTASTLRERDLSSRLSYFLPALAAANKVLDEDRVAGTLEQKRLETVTKDEPYIEMNLGLGVLEEKQGESSDTYSSSESFDDEEDGPNPEALNSVTVFSPSANPQPPPDRVLDRLMGRKHASTTLSKPQIKEVEHG